MTQETRTRQKITSRFTPQIANDVISLLLGNRLVLDSEEKINDHKEQGIVVGDNLNWLINDQDFHLFGVSGHSNNPEQSFTVGCTILQENLLKGRIDPSKGLLLAIVLSAHTHESFIRKQKRLEGLVVKYSEMIKPFVCVTHHSLYQISSCVFCVETGEVYFRHHNDNEVLSPIAQFLVSKVNDHVDSMRQIHIPHLPALVVECMDPRVCLCANTKIKAHRVVRSAGAQHVNLPHIDKKIKILREYAEQRNTRPVVFSTYHYSEVNPLLGCRGHSTVEGAKSNAFEIATHAHELGVTPVVLVVNTDKREVGVDLGDEIVFSSQL